MNHKRVDLLLVEDNPRDAEMILGALKKQDLGEHVQVARDGAAALEALFAPGPEGTELVENLKVIFLDLKLPKVSGLEVLQKLKSEARTRSIPVVVLTSSLRESDVQECYRLGANSFVVKPTELDSFTQTLGQLGTYWLEMNQTISG
jgi:two-component system response regulator